MIDFAAEAAAEAAHDQALARIPGWQPYIMEKAKRYAKADPAMYGRLPALVVETIREAAQQ